MLILIPIVGPFLTFASWAVEFIIEATLNFTNPALMLFGLTKPQLELLAFGIIALEF